MVQKNSSNTENLRNKELIEELLLKLTSIIKDTHSVSILTELLINENITVTELIEKPSIKNSMKKSLLYARLKELESEGIITSTYKVQTSDSDRGYAVKSYSLKTSFFNLLDENLTDFSRKKPRETRLFGLYMIKSFLNREIDRLINSTNEDLIQNRGNIKGTYGGLVTLSKEEHDELQQKFNEMMQFLDEKKKKNEHGSSLQPYGFYYGFYYLPEKDNFDQ